MAETVISIVLLAVICQVLIKAFPEEVKCLHPLLGTYCKSE